MRIGTLTTGIGNFGQKGFYNTQEIGLGKELDKFFDEVIVYKAVDLKQQKQSELIEGCRNSFFVQIPVKRIGANGIWNCSELDCNLDALIYFSDTQFSLPQVYKWCKKNNVLLFPYIGVIQSHSTNIIARRVMQLLFYRNISIYKKSICFAKTPHVAKELGELGVENIVLAPVGIDKKILKKDYEKCDINNLRLEFGIDTNQIVILFIGRMTDEKQPLRMVEIFRVLYGKVNNAKLIMVGKGELLSRVKEAGKDLPITFLDQVPYPDIWKLYLISNVFVNLNQHEIFGMAILEAMYYGCKVVAWNAPGPDSIILNGQNGWLINSNTEAVEKIMDEIIFCGKDYVLDNYTWEKTAGIMSYYINKKLGM